MSRRRRDEIVATVIVGAAILVIAFLLGGCGDTAAGGTAAEQRSPAVTERIITESGAEVMVDLETGCHYLAWLTGSSAAMTVRYRADGTPMCGDGL